MEPDDPKTRPCRVLTQPAQGQLVGRGQDDENVRRRMPTVDDSRMPDGEGECGMRGLTRLASRRKVDTGDQVQAGNQTLTVRHVIKSNNRPQQGFDDGRVVGRRYARAGTWSGGTRREGHGMGMRLAALLRRGRRRGRRTGLRRRSGRVDGHRGRVTGDRVRSTQAHRRADAAALRASTGAPWSAGIRIDSDFASCTSGPDDRVLHPPHRGAARLLRRHDRHPVDLMLPVGSPARPAAWARAVRPACRAGGEARRAGRGRPRRDTRRAGPPS